MASSFFALTQTSQVLKFDTPQDNVLVFAILYVAGKQ